MSGEPVDTDELRQYAANLASHRPERADLVAAAAGELDRLRVWCEAYAQAERRARQLVEMVHGEMRNNPFADMNPDVIELVRDYCEPDDAALAGDPS